MGIQALVVFEMPPFCAEYGCHDIAGKYQGWGLPMLTPKWNMLVECLILSLMFFDLAARMMTHGSSLFRHHSVER